MRRFFGFLLTMALLGGGVFWLPYLQAEPVDKRLSGGRSAPAGRGERRKRRCLPRGQRGCGRGVPGAGGAVSIRIRAARGNTAEQDHRAERRGFPAGAAGAGVGVCQGAGSWFDLTDHDGRGETACAARYLIRQCEYDVDTAEEDAPDGSAPAFAADGALLDHKAVCAGYGRAYEMLCKAAGIQVIYVASEEMNHGWNAVRLGGTTYYIDCTFDDPIPDRGEYVSDQYFMLTGDELAQTHTWNEAFYEQLLDSLEQGGK